MTTATATEACQVTAPSRALAGHTHTCSGTHQDGMHKCAAATCRRWFGGRR